MGKIFYIFGKSATGKDTLYKRLLLDEDINLRPVVLYTTRPMREGEVDGSTYFFVNEDRLQEMDVQGKIVEHRVYDTVFGPWHYFMADDGNMDLSMNNYIVIGTLEAYSNVRKYYGEAVVVPLYIYVEDGTRLIRSIERERQQIKPAYDEVCRRFLADSLDFSDEKLLAAGIEKGFENLDLTDCYKKIKEEILKYY